MSLNKTKFCYNNHKKIKYFYKVQFNVTYLNLGRSLKANQNSTFFGNRGFTSFLVPLKDVQLRR